VALSKFIAEKNEIKSNSLESKMYTVVRELIEECGGYDFTNDQIWMKCKKVMDGTEIYRESFYSIDLGKVTHKRVTKLYISKFKAEPYQTSGNDSKRGLRFKKEVLDRIGSQYKCTDEIKIISEDEKQASDNSDKDKPASDASLASVFKSAYGILDKNNGCTPPKLGESSEPSTDAGIVKVSSYNHNNNNNNNNNSNNINNIGTNQSDSDYGSPPLTSESAIIPANQIKLYSNYLYTPKQEVLSNFRASKYQDCRINAYPYYIGYKGINLTAPSFIMIDLDLKDFDHVHERLNTTLHKTLMKIDGTFHSVPTVLWTGNGYHVYQPVDGFVLEEIDRFNQFVDSNKKDLTSRFMQFAEGYFTENNSDLHHRPSIKSCLIRIPGTINSKRNQEVKVVQKWNGTRPSINYLLREFRTWLVSEIIKDKRKVKSYSKRPKPTKNRFHNFGYTTNSITWIEKLLQTPIADNRKYVIWRILVPYLFNVKRLLEADATEIIQTWLHKCHILRSLDFNANYLIKQNIRNRSSYLPISFTKLSSENYALYNIISEG
jgi:hypothetical protein